jgi:hypothetical protein
MIKLFLDLMTMVHFVYCFHKPSSGTNEGLLQLSGIRKLKCQTPVSRLVKLSSAVKAEVGQDVSIRSPLGISFDGCLVILVVDADVFILIIYCLLSHNVESTIH